MIIVNRLRQRIWMPFAALVVAIVLAAIPPMDALERLAGDIQHNVVARNAYFRDAVVIDIDETSLRGLKAYLGEWPYERDIYGQILDYLDEQGAAAVVFDIVMADRRAGDDAFARSLRERKIGVLAAVTPTGDTSMTEREVALLAKLRREVPPSLPRTSWPSLLLPNESLLEGAPDVVVGVAAAVADPDGILRRMPLMHETLGNVLPGLPIAAIDASAYHRGKVGDPLVIRAPWSNWPLDSDGFVHLYFPANANAVMSLPFQDVAEAALGLSGLRDAAQFFRGKTVFIGSSAYLSDRVNTPRGPMSGTYVLATMHQTLQQGLVWVPPTAGWNAFMIALAITALVGLLLIPSPSWQLSLVWLATSVAVIWTAHIGLLVFVMQEAVLLPPLLVLATGWGIHVLHEQGRLQQRTRELEIEADIDGLTGLPVRRTLLRTFQRDMAAARRRACPLSVAILDFDHFKRINDTFGHPMGDLVLTTFADVLRRCLRASDSAGRWGGEEFVVLLPDTDAAGAVVVLDKIRATLGAEQFPAPADLLKVTISAGVVQYDGDELSPEALLYVADGALYDAKGAGRNRVCVANEVGAVSR